MIVNTVPAPRAQGVQKGLKAVNRAGVPASTLAGKALSKMDYDVQAEFRPDTSREKRNARTELFPEMTALGGRLEGGCLGSSGFCRRTGSSFRGGNWNNAENNLRVSDRNNAANPNADRNNNYGFRLVRTHSILKTGGPGRPISGGLAHPW